MKILNDIAIYGVIQEIYKGKGVVLSNWVNVDYITDNK